MTTFGAVLGLSSQELFFEVMTEKGGPALFDAPAATVRTGDSPFLILDES
jgi:hypothetical protein